MFQNDSVDSSLKESFSDIVYKTEIIPEKIPVYLLFEHKSYPDSQIGIQIEKYVHSPQILNKLDEICVLFKEMSKKVDVNNFFDTFSLYVQNAAPDNLIEQSVKKI